MKLIDQIRNVEYRFALIIGALILAYLYFFSLPEVWSACCSWWYSFYSFISHPLSGTIGYLSIMSVAVLSLLTGITIWILSIVVTCALFRITKEKAYLFLIAYFLLPIAIHPTSLMIRKTIAHSPMLEQANHQAWQEMEFTQPKEVVPHPFVIRRNYSLPLGEALLLTGLWFLYRKERMKCGENVAPCFSLKQSIIIAGTLLLLLIITCLLRSLVHAASERGYHRALTSPPQIIIKGAPNPLFQYNVQSRGETNSRNIFRVTNECEQGAGTVR